MRALVCCRFVPTAQRVTLYWLESCLASHRLYDPCMKGTPAYRPLPYELPCKHFGNVKWVL